MALPLDVGSGLVEEDEGPVHGDTRVRGRVVKEDDDEETHGIGGGSGGVEEVDGPDGQGTAHGVSGGGGSAWWGAGESSR